MKNIGRLLQIIYREIDISELIKHHEFSVNISDKNYLAPFLLDNELFIENIVKRYLEVFPDNYSYTEIRATISGLCSKLYDTNGSENANCLDIFLYCAKNFLSQRGNELIVDFDQLISWDSIINQSDSALFVAAYRGYLSSKGYKPFRLSGPVLKHNNSRIYKILDKGISENHMHLNGSGNTWEINWYFLVTSDVFDSSKIEKVLATVFVDKRKQSDFLIFIEKIKIIRKYLYMKFSDKENKVVFETELDSLDNWNHLLASSCECDFICFGQKIDDHWKAFTKMDLFDTSDSKYHLKNEMDFLTNLFSSLYNRQLSGLEKYLFNIYIAARTQIKYFFIQDNIGMGFAKFKDKAAVKKTFVNDNMTSLLYETVFDKYYNDGCINKVEFRVSPKSKEKFIEMINLLDKANKKSFEYHEKQNPSLKKIEYGLIVHYIKSPNTWKLENVKNSCRHHKLRAELRKQSKKIKNCFESYDIKEEDKVEEYIKKYEKVSDTMVHKKIVGIDAANTEIFCPPEVFAPIFTDQRKEISRNQKLSFTFHVGEDFLTIVSGLRTIDEAIEFLGYQRGDRLGHASALGLDIEKYFHIKRKRIITNLQNHVDDLAWMYSLLRNSKEVEPYILEYLIASFKQQQKKLYSGCTNVPKDIDEYIDSYMLRGRDPDSDWSILNTSLGYNPERSAMLHFYDYHYDLTLKNNGDIIVEEIADEKYIQAAILSQKIMIKKIHDKGIYIEANPSSNKKISYISKYIDLPFLKLNNMYLNDQSNNYSLPVSINTDDSAIFQTSLANEYSLIAAALFLEGFNSESIYQFINYLRKLSNTMSFVEN